MDPITTGAIISAGRDLIGRIWPDPKDQAEELRKLEELNQKGELAELQAYIQVMQARLSVIKTEAASDNFLTSSWRPVVMLVFTALIVARWFGFSAEGVSEAEYMEIWAILKLGIGGYVVGRSAEKVVKEYKKR